MTRQKPPVPPDCDLRSYDWFPFYHKRMRQSAFWKRASDAACRISVEFWSEAYEQVPAGSLPDDDVQLSDWAGFGRRNLAEWLAIKDEVMSAWTLCDDGRWYHQTLCEVALSAWKERLEHIQRREDERRRKEEYRRRKDGAQGLDDSGNASLSAGHPQMSHGTTAAVPPENPLKGTGKGTEEDTHTQGAGASIDLRRQNLEAAEAAGDALASMATCPGIASLAPIRMLLVGEKPCDWNEDVLPAITAAAAWHRARDGPGSMRSWTTAAKIAVENRDRRLAGLPAPKVIDISDARRQPEPPISVKRARHEANMAAALAGAQLAAERGRRGGIGGDP